MADDATRTSTTSLEDDDDQRYLDDAAWARREVTDTHAIATFEPGEPRGSAHP